MFSFCSKKELCSKIAEDGLRQLQDVTDSDQHGEIRDEELSEDERLLIDQKQTEDQERITRTTWWPTFEHSAKQQWPPLM